jgi:predicted MFS family arabinose efflux permease
MSFRGPLLGPLGERDFRLFFVGQSISLLGSGMVGVALSFAVLDLTGRVSDLGFVLAALTVSQVAFLLVGGVVADRLSRRSVMVGADLVSCVSQATTAALLISGSAQLWQLIVLQVAAGAAAAFFQPAAVGFVPEIVRAERLQQANALRSFTTAGGAIAGPAIAGLLVATVGPGWALLADAASFAASAGFLSRVHLRGRETWAGGSLLYHLVEGWKEYWATRWLVLVNVNATLINVFVMAPFEVLGPAVSKASLGGAGAWALIISSDGAGGLLGSVIGLRLSVRHRLSFGLALGVLWAPVLAAIALRLPAAAIAPIAFVGGIVGTIRFVCNQTTGHEQFPPDLLSRLASFGSVGSIAFAPLGYAITGLLAAHLLGIGGTLWLAAAVAVAASLATALAPAVWRIQARVAGPAPQLGIE